MTSVPTGILIAQWLALAVLGGFIWLLFRQIAYLGDLAAPATDAYAIPDGTPAPSFMFAPFAAGSEARERQRFDAAGVATLLLFADPYCEACEDLVSAAGEWESQRPNDIRMLVCCDAPAERLAGVPAFRDADVDIALVDDAVFHKLYGVRVTPMVFAIAADGRVVTSGFANSVGSLESLAATARSGEAPQQEVLHGSHHNGRPVSARV